MLGRVDEPSRAIGVRWRSISSACSALAALRTHDSTCRSRTAPSGRRCSLRAMSPARASTIARAIELRQAVLLEDPENDWARKGLALGAQRMAFVQGRGGDLEDAVQWLERGLEFPSAAAAHPERDRPWVDLATAIFESATEGVLWLEAPAVPPGTRLRVARQLDGLLEDLAQLRARWARERRGPRCRRPTTTCSACASACAVCCPPPPRVRRRRPQRRRPSSSPTQSPDPACPFRAA